MPKKSTKSAAAPVPVANVPAAAPPPRFNLALSLDSLAGLGCANLAAVTRASLSLSQGMEAIGQEMLRCTESAFVSAGYAASALIGGEALDAVFQVGTELAAASLDALLLRSVRVCETGARLAGLALAPAVGRTSGARLHLAPPTGV